MVKDRPSRLVTKILIKTLPIWIYNKLSACLGIKNLPQFARNLYMQSR